MGLGRRRQRNPDNLLRTTLPDITIQPISETRLANKDLGTSYADMPRHKRGYREEQERFKTYRQSLPSLQPNPKKDAPTNLGPAESTLRGVASVNNPEGKRTRDYPVSSKMRASRGHCTLQGRDEVWRSHTTTVDMGRRCSSTVDIRASIADEMGLRPKRFSRKVYRKLDGKKIKGIGTVTLPLKTLKREVEHREAVVWEDNNVTFDVRLHHSIASRFVKVDEIDSPPPSPRGVLRHAPPVPPPPPSTPVESTGGDGSEATVQPPPLSFEELVRLLDADPPESLSPLVETTMDMSTPVETANMETQAAGPSFVIPNQAGSASGHHLTQNPGPSDDFVLPEPLDSMRPSTQTEEVAYDNIRAQVAAGTFGLSSNQSEIRSYENTLDLPVNMDYQMFPPQTSSMDYADTPTQLGAINDGNAYLLAHASSNQPGNQNRAANYASVANQTGAIGVGRFPNQAGAGNFQPVNQMAVGFNQGAAYNSFGNVFDINQYGQLNQAVENPPPQPQDFGMSPMSLNMGSRIPVRTAQRYRNPHATVRMRYTRRSAQSRIHEPRHMNMRHMNMYGTSVPNQTPAQNFSMGGPHNEPQAQAQARPIDETLPNNTQNNQADLDWIGEFSTVYPNTFDPSFFDSN